MSDSSHDWRVNQDYASKNKFEKFAAQYSREYASLFANFQKIFDLLRSGNKIGGFHVGFFRSEGEGVFRIGQTGVPSAKESRLYLYPDSETKIIFVLTIGTKDSQTDDINEAKEAARRIKKTAEK